MRLDDTRNNDPMRADALDDANAELGWQRGASIAKIRDDAQPDEKTREGVAAGTKSYK